MHFFIVNNNGHVRRIPENWLRVCNRKYALFTVVALFRRRCEKTTKPSDKPTPANRKVIEQDVCVRGGEEES